MWMEEFYKELEMVMEKHNKNKTFTFSQVNTKNFHHEILNEASQKNSNL
jgi:hypothetical protein